MLKIDLERVVFRSTRFNVVSQTISLGSKSEERELIDMGDGVSMVILDSKNNVCLIKEWRSAFNSYIYQLPGGYCGDSREDALIKAAKQEIQEELGLANTEITLEKLKIFYPLGAMRNTVHIYIARVNQFAQKPKSEAFEDIELASMPLDEAHTRFVLENEPTTAATIIGLNAAKNLIVRNRR